jgi:hypothetical protein
MAGLVAPSPVNHRSRGVLKLAAVVTADASGVVSAGTIGDVTGRIVGVTVKPGTLDIGNTIFTVTDHATGKAIITWDTDALKFKSTTTDDYDAAGGALFTAGANHGLTAGDIIEFISVAGDTGFTIGTHYCVLTAGLTATQFCLGLAAGGASGAKIAGVTADMSAATWINLTQIGNNPGQGATYRTSPSYFLPTSVITLATGVAVTGGTGSGGAGTGNAVNRDIYVSGKIDVSVAQGGNLGSGTFYLIVDESIIGGEGLNL